MGRKGSKGGGAKKRGAPGATIDKIERYEDTLEEGGVDDFMFKRDQISFNPQNDDGDDDINGEQGEEVLSLDPKRRRGDDDEEMEEEYDEDEEESFGAAAQRKERKQKVKPDLSTKGRFGKEEIDSDASSEDDSESGSEDEDEEGWGRQYYSRPSARREKEKEGVYDETREEERELEEKEVRRLQRRAREALDGDDWGLDDVEVEHTAAPVVETEDAAPVHVPAPKTDDPIALLRHLQVYEPLKLALTRDFSLVVYKLKKTARGIKKMAAEREGEESLHKGLGWLHYQTLLTYATTLAFYIHLCALPADERPDMSTHPILQRLLQLKEGVAALEDLDFAAGSISDAGPELFIRPDEGDEDEDEEDGYAEMIAAKRELLARTNEGAGMVPEDDEFSDEDDDEDEDEDEEDEFDWEQDAQNLWHTAGMEDGELDDLLADADADDADSVPASKPKSTKREKRSRKKDSKSTEEGASTVAFTPMAEPEFVSSKKKKSKARAYGDDEETMGDATSLDDADAADKETKKRSLRFHTSKIAATSARRSAARDKRLGGDDDIPYRDRQAARDAALRKNGPKGNGGEDLDGSDWTESDRKRAREVRDEADDDEPEGDDGYYDLVKRRKTAKDEAKQLAHEAYREEKFASFEDETSEGPRALTRAIEKNRGLTPRRSKTGRNPRVKKKLAYEKAKQKVGSQRAVFKGGQATLSGSYSGEKTGISLTAKSRKF